MNGGNLLAVKMRRDLKATWPRFLMMVIAIAICLAAFGSVLFAWATSGRESTNAYMSTEPASATILLDQPVDVDQMAEMAGAAAEQAGVIEATGRTQFSSDVAVDGERREIPLQTFVAAPDDPMRMARVFGSSSWPVGPDEVLIGADSLALLDVSVGDVVSIETPGGEIVDLRVADAVNDPSLSPSPQEQTGRAYVSSAALPGPGGQIGLDQLKIQVADEDATVPSEDRDRIVAVADDIGAWLESTYGVTIREIQVPTPYAHPHQWQADALLLSLLAGASAALLLSTILVANMLNNLFTQQIPQIGILKAIGARSGRVGRFYLTMTLIIACAATLLAFPVAVLLGRVAVSNFLGFLGITAESLAPPAWTYLVLLGVGLLIPPLMALPPVLRAGRITVREAMDHHGGSAPAGAASAAVARLSRIQRLDRGLLLALRNTVRRPARFFLSVGLLACAGTVFVAGMSLSSGVEAVEEIGNERITWDVDVQLAKPASLDQVERLAEKIPDVTLVEGFVVGPTGVAGEGRVPVTRTYPDQGHGRVAIVTVPADSTTFVKPDLIEGRWLKPGETGAVVLNQTARENSLPGVAPGDDVQLILDGKATSWQVVGIVQERHGGGGVYATPEGYAQATGRPAQVTTLRVETASHDEETRQAVADAITKTFSDGGIEVASAVSVSRAEEISGGHLGPVILILLGIALPLGVVGLIGLASTMGANVLDRTREFGIMHAIGARPKAVRRIVVAEGLFLAVTSVLVSVLPALGLTAVLGAGLGDLFFNAPLPYRISLPAAGVWTALAVLGAILATEAAATRASRITVREALAYL